MNNYAKYAEYLRSLGLCKRASEAVCRKFEKAGDLEGLMEFVLCFEKMVSCCVG